MEDGAKHPPRPPHTPEEKLRDALLGLQVHQVAPTFKLYPRDRTFLLAVLERRRAGQLELWERNVIAEFEREGLDLDAVAAPPALSH